MTETLPKPPWLRKRFPLDGSFRAMEHDLRANRLHTVCQEALCPNRGECFTRGVATFLIMGNVCTRDCRFCAVRSGRPLPLDPDEPARIAGEVRNLGLRFAVITSVTRDDLPGRGRHAFCEGHPGHPQGMPGRWNRDPRSGFHGRQRRPWI